MPKLTQEELENLRNACEQDCISIYMPTHRVGAETEQDPIRLENLLTQAEEKLLAKDYTPVDVEERLSPGYELVADRDFWHHQSDGLAVFISPGTARAYRLPLDFEELVMVEDRFYLKPLLRLFSSEGRFYILTLSQDGIRLLDATHYTVDEIDLEDVPPSLAEALRYDDPERQLQFHTASRTPGGRGERPAVFHGQGVGKELDEKENIQRYFQQLDRALQEWLAGEEVPLVLAGVDYLLPIYREVSDYPHLVEEGVEGSPEPLNVREIHARAWPIVEPLFRAEREEAAALYRQLEGQGKPLVSDEIERILPAAHYGRVDTLFVAQGEQHWGTFDRETGEVRSFPKGRPESKDLLDDAAMQTLLNDGKVYVVGVEDMPTDPPVAAIFRYEYTEGQ